MIAVVTFVIVALLAVGASSGSSTIIALAAVVVAPLVAWVVAYRRMSGRIATSDASDLWEASKTLREEYREEIRGLRRDLADCESRVGRVEERNRSLSRENDDLRHTIEEHEETIRHLQAEVTRLTADNVTLRARLEESNGN